MPKHIRLESDLGRLMPGIVRYTDASGATVYSSHSYQPTKGHSRGASTYTNSDFEGWSDDTPIADLQDMVNHEVMGSEDEDPEDERHGHEDRKDDGYEDHGHEDCHPPGLHEVRL